MWVCVILAIIVISHIVLFLLSKFLREGKKLKDFADFMLPKFKYNIYIRYYMVTYFDTTFFAVMKIWEQRANDTHARRFAYFIAVLLLIANILLPIFFFVLLQRRYFELGIKDKKRSFNALLLRIDKNDRFRIANPTYFFARRFVMAVLLTLPLESSTIFMQYVFILMSSHGYVLYLALIQPYATLGLNLYVLISETFFSALVIAIFIFSDATPEVSVKLGAGVALILSLILIIVVSVIITIYNMVKGREAIKDLI